MQRRSTWASLLGSIEIIVMFLNSLGGFDLSQWIPGAMGIPRPLRMHYGFDVVVAGSRVKS
ncbi:hypothetical protein AKJ16_DCAP09139 [Drosera capensis]